MEKKFKFTDEAMCPKCGKSIDDCPASDCIIFLPGGKPSDQISKDQCGWCNVNLTFQKTGDNEITIKTK